MAESGSGQEKTEEATGKKKDESRSEGQIPRSRELNTLVMLLFAGIGLATMGKNIVSELLKLLHSHFTLTRARIFEDNLLPQQVWDAFGDGLTALLPFFVLMVVAAILAPLALGGWAFSTKALMLKISKMNPIKGMSRILSWKGLIELFKALLKFILVAFVGYLLFQSKIAGFLLLGNLQVDQGLETMASSLIWVFILLSSSLILVALIDVPFQLWDYQRQLKMTKQEVKDETKDAEGNPEVKSKVRSAQLKYSHRRMMEAVPEADVVITNPTHYSVAIKYDQLKMSAPVVVAVGADIDALQIRKVAKAHDVPILEAPALARSLYYNADLGQEIPAGLYHAVAQVLAYIYQLKQYQNRSGVQPKPINDLPIPDDLRRDE